MIASHKRAERVLAIDPYLRGFGWALLEGPNLLVDWGIYQARTKQPEPALGRVAALLHRYSPQLVIIEDIRRPRCRRRERARTLISEISDMASAADVEVHAVAMEGVREHYRNLGAKSKDAVARLVVDRFPELRPILPPRRKNWMREDERMAVFDAITMALVTTGGARPRTDRAADRHLD